jgi:hypothetical protein
MENYNVNAHHYKYNSGCEFSKQQTPLNVYPI